jgi:hypothetical protein
MTPKGCAVGSRLPHSASAFISDNAHYLGWQHLLDIPDGATAHAI